MNYVNGLAIPDGDTHFAEAILANPLFRDKGTYQWNKLSAALPICDPARRRLAVDVGAHIGTWSRVLAYEFERVVAFEPVPEFVECFSKNVSDVRNVALHQVALGELAGPGTGFIREEGNSGNSRFATLAEHHICPPNMLAIVRTLDDYGFVDLDFLKIDTEGFERQVVMGGQNTIRMLKPVIVVEQKPGHAQRYGHGDTAAVKLLQSWGYTVVWSKAGDYCLKWG